jgi:hypothetical protein
MAGAFSGTSSGLPLVGSLDAPSGLHRRSFDVSADIVPAGSYGSQIAGVAGRVDPIANTYYGANAAACSGLPTLGTGSGQLNPSSGAVPISGTVTVGTNNDKSGYTLDLTQAGPTLDTARAVGDALNAARAQGFGNLSGVRDR